MTDYRISIEELENEAMIMEMARNLIADAFSEIEDLPKERIDETEQIELPF
jgi:hypothetical protein